LQVRKGEFEAAARKLHLATELGDADAMAQVQACEPARMHGRAGRS
jgi:hypothetical protein